MTAIKETQRAPAGHAPRPSSAGAASSDAAARARSAWMCDGSASMECCGAWASPEPALTHSSVVLVAADAHMHAQPSSTAGSFPVAWQPPTPPRLRPTLTLGMGGRHLDGGVRHEGVWISRLGPREEWESMGRSRVSARAVNERGVVLGLGGDAQGHGASFRRGLGGGGGRGTGAVPVPQEAQRKPRSSRSCGSHASSKPTSSPWMLPCGVQAERGREHGRQRRGSGRHEHGSRWMARRTRSYPSSGVPVQKKQGSRAPARQARSPQGSRRAGPPRFASRRPGPRWCCWASSCRVGVGVVGGG